VLSVSFSFLSASTYTLWLSAGPLQGYSPELLGYPESSGVWDTNQGWTPTLPSAAGSSGVWDKTWSLWSQDEPYRAIQTLTSSYSRANSNSFHTGNGVFSVSRQLSTPTDPQQVLSYLLLKRAAMLNC